MEKWEYLNEIDKIFDFQKIKRFISFFYPFRTTIYRGGKLDSCFLKLSKKYYNEILKFIENPIEEIMRR